MKNSYKWKNYEEKLTKKDNILRQTTIILKTTYYLIR